MRNRPFGGAKIVRLAAMVALMGGAAGCRTMSDVIQAKNANEGTMHVYAVTCDDAYNMAIAVFREEGAEGIEEHRSEGYMLTSSGMGLFSAGTLMGAWFEPAQKTSCAVTCVTKRKIATNAVTTLTETTFHEKMAQAIAKKTGAPSPSAAPRAAN